MTLFKRKYKYTLFDFQGNEMARLFQNFEKTADAIAHGGRLLWKYSRCARVLIEGNYYFKVTIVWDDNNCI